MSIEKEIGRSIL